ncbi:GNAT family N-acetyltransferase [Baekduia soli]|uniref:GNAT family N-acetyltransferase n=1 Tax=Baekduia soli TaxID=496014 RepID=A0A5B8U2J9_9ACTN|nr:GNAT family N-acetyltransferase [Baekduia soli]QEC47152.1 GNAT family N-acetyltransferase [Baekduia soli]
MTVPADAQLPEIVLRPIRPDDKDALVAGLGRLSDRSVYERFLSPKPRLSRSELAYLTEIDGHDHHALVAVLARSPGVIVAVGRWVREADAPQRAEVAVVVADDLQGRGVGRRLGAALAQAGAERGVEAFIATMLPSNTAAQRLMAGMARDLACARARRAASPAAA